MKHWLTFLLFFCSCALQAAAFTSKDGRFTLDMPSGWSAAKTPAAGAVLSVVKGSSRLDVKSFPKCKDEACIERQAQADLEDVKKKKMQVVGNSYTGEEIKRIDFSTGDPFFYISFFTPKNDFSAGYFLIGQNAYSVLAKDLSYAQTDLIFSFISPVQENAPALEMDVSDERAYDIEAVPFVAQEELATDTPLQTVPVKTTEQPKKNSAPAHVKLPRTLITRNMPPYIQQMGHGFDALVLLLLLYGLLQAGALAVRPFIKPHAGTDTVNPYSPYPVKFQRLYGTPSLIYRARDNQGNVIISLTPRWDSLFLFGGIIIIVSAAVIMAAAGVLESTRLTGWSPFAYNMIYSAISLAIPLGFVVFICGILWSQLVMRQFALYDRKGQRAAYVTQRGFGLKKECYLIYFAKSGETLLLEKKRFSFLHKWQLSDKRRNVLAHVTEDNVWRAAARKLTGHLWGFLRASYRIEGPMDSRGGIINTRQAMNRFICNMDKPQALSARDMLACALIINIRDRDKWYPWF